MSKLDETEKAYRRGVQQGLFMVHEWITENPDVSVHSVLDEVDEVVQRMRFDEKPHRHYMHEVLKHLEEWKQ